MKTAYCLTEGLGVFQVHTSPKGFHPAATEQQKNRPVHVGTVFLPLGPHLLSEVSEEVRQEQGYLRNEGDEQRTEQ